MSVPTSKGVHSFRGVIRITAIEVAALLDCVGMPQWRYRKYGKLNVCLFRYVNGGHDVFASAHCRCRRSIHSQQHVAHEEHLARRKHHYQLPVHSTDTQTNMQWIRPLLIQYCQDCSLWCYAPSDNVKVQRSSRTRLTRHRVGEQVEGSYQLELLLDEACHQKILATNPRNSECDIQAHIGQPEWSHSKHRHFDTGTSFDVTLHTIQTVLNLTG